MLLLPLVFEGVDDDDLAAAGLDAGLAAEAAATSFCFVAAC